MLDLLIRAALILLLIISAAPGSFATATLPNASRTRQMWQEGREALGAADFHKAAKIGQALEQAADPVAEACGHILQAQANVMLAKPQEALVHLRAVELADPAAIPDSVLCSFYNGQGLYSINVENDSYAALSSYYKAYETAKRAGHKSMEAVALNNIVSIHYLRKEAAGLEYALESLALSREMGDPSLRLGALTQSALMTLLSGDPKAAIPYCEELETLVEEKLPNHRASAYNTIGDVWAAMQNPARASQYYHRALRYADPTDADAVTLAYLGLAGCCLQEGQFSKADEWLAKAEQLSKPGESLFADDIGATRVRLLEATGDYRGALKKYQQLSLARDSIFNAEKERDIQQVRARFDLERHENQLAKQRIDLLSKQRTIYALAGAIALVALAGAMGWRMYRRKKRLYESIVRQNSLSLAREQSLLATIEHLKSSPPEENPQPDDAPKYRKSSLNRERHREIIEKIEHAMQVEMAYKSKNFTKEMLAEMVGSNRTYLSQVVNDEFNMSFTQYVNSYRAREAVRILSLPDDDTPLKTICADLGFSSMTTFYAVFREATGMTPSAYRDVVRKQHLSAASEE